MAKLSLATITTGYAAVSSLNGNFDAIETAMENTLSRDGTSPNQMQADLDLNGFSILNQGNAVNITGFQWRGSWITARVYAVGDVIENSGTSYVCISAHTSGVFATDLAASKWQLLASASLPSQTGQAGKLLTTNGSAASWTGNPLDVTSGGTGVTSIPGLQSALGLGSAAYLNVGTGNTNVVQLDAVGLPAVDGSRLLNLPSSTFVFPEYLYAARGII